MELIKSLDFVKVDEKDMGDGKRLFCTILEMACMK